MGQLIEVYHTCRPSIVTPIVIASCLWLIVVVIAVIVLSGRIGRVPIGGEIAFIVVGLSAFAAIMTYWGFKNLLNWQKLLIFSAGIVRLRLGRSDEFRWDEVQLFEKATQWNPQAIWLKRPDGKRVSFHGLGQEERLSTWTKAEFREKVYPAASETYQSGEIVYFEKFGVSQSGLTYKSKTLQWKDIDWLGINPHGFFVVAKTGRPFFWAAVHPKKIPNFFLFQELVERHIPFTDFRRKQCE